MIKRIQNRKESTNEDIPELGDLGEKPQRRMFVENEDRKHFRPTNYNLLAEKSDQNIFFS